MKKRTMQPTEHAEYRLPQDFCCANKTVLNCPSSSADKFYVYYNYSSPSLPTADKTYDSYFDWDNATQELFLDVEGVINTSSRQLYLWCLLSLMLLNYFW